MFYMGFIPVFIVSITPNTGISGTKWGGERAAGHRKYRGVVNKNKVFDILKWKRIIFFVM